ncbi:TetR/AcrR family transcriptional regulator [Nocardia sp. NPDC058379]|uniref:TetR/AcrR family transcriptional regulator n=1 Tax=unclassified Nocardia TaxID=2637762 RepID=UPI00365F12EE
MTTLDEIAERAVREAERLNRPVADLTLAEIATAAGVSRSTLIRRIGSRGALEDALRARGMGEASRRSTAADRAIAAAARLYAERGVGPVSLEDVAAEAGCTVQAIYGQIGGREALLLAVADRYSPLPEIEQALAEPAADLASGALARYRRIMESVFGDPPVVIALIAEMLSRPDGPMADYLRSSYAPRSAAALEAWLRPFLESGRIRPLSPSVLLSLFAGPIVLFNMAHIVNRQPLSAVDFEPIARELAEAFVRAVGAP